MALVITIADNGDNTGAVATVTGSDSGQTVTIYTQKPPATTWTSSGSRSGNGTVALSLAAGYYWAYASGTVSGVSAVSAIVGLFAVTRANTSMQSKIHDALIADAQAIATASLPGLSSSNIYKRKATPLDESNANLPGLFISCPLTDTFQPRTNLRENVGHPFLYQLLTGKDIEDVTDYGDITLWRERLIRRYISSHLSGVSEAIDCNVEPGPIFDPRLPTVGKTLSQFVLRFICREPHGI